MLREKKSPTLNSPPTLSEADKHAFRLASKAARRLIDSDSNVYPTHTYYSNLVKAAGTFSAWYTVVTGDKLNT
jgi:hypothetical protein